MLEVRNSFFRLGSTLLLSLMAWTPLAAQATAPVESGWDVEAMGADSRFEAMAALSAELNPDALASNPTALPVQISEAPPTPSVAPDSIRQMSAEVSRVANYIASYNKRLDSQETAGIAQAIVHFSNRYGVDYRLLTSLIAVESSFRKDVVSSSGAIGMGQLKPDTARWLGVLNPYDPVDNIAGTARFLSWLVRKYNGNLEYALSGYYQGPGYVDRNGITPVCMPYLQKINRALGSLM